MINPKSHLAKELEFASKEKKLSIIAHRFKTKRKLIETEEIKYAAQLLLDLKPEEIDINAYKIADVVSQHYRDKNLYDKALEYTKQAVDFAFKIHDIAAEISALFRLTSILLETGKFKEALDSSFKALRICEEINDQKALAQSLYNIGRINFQLGHHTDALNFFARSLEIKQKLHDECGIIDIYQNLSSVYHQLGNLSAALEYAEKVLNYYHNLKNTNKIAHIYHTVAEIFVSMGQTNQAIEFYNKSLTLKLQTAAEVSIIDSYLGIAECYKQNSQIEAAIHSYKQAEIISRKLNANESLATIFLQLSLLFRQKVDYQAAYEYLQKYTEAHNKLRTLDFEKQINRLNEKLDLIKNEKEKEIYRLKNQELATANTTKNKLFSLVAHELAPVYYAFQSNYNQLLTKVDGFGQEDVKIIIEEMKTTLRNSRDLFENLIAWSRFNLDEMPFQPEPIAIFELVNKTAAGFVSEIKAKDINLENWVSKDITAYADREMLRIVLRNLISNAIKFTGRKGKIVINASLIGDFVELTVKDNGLGIKKELAAKIFSLADNFSHPNRRRKIRTGLGLSLCKELMNKNGGNISVESIEGKGSIFSVLLPIKG